MKASVGSSLKQSHTNTRHANNHTNNDKHSRLVESGLIKKINSIKKAWDNGSSLLTRKAALKLKKKLFGKLTLILTKSVSTKSKTLALLTLNYIENSYYWRYHVKDNAKGVSKLYINRLTNFALQYANYAGKKDAKKVVKDYKSKLLLISAKLSDKMQIYTQGNINKLQH